MDLRQKQQFLYKAFIIGVFLLSTVFGTDVCAENVEESDQSEMSTAELSSPQEGNVTLDFKEADINNVLRVLSYKSGVNIVAGRDVQGTVTIRLTDVPWEKALDVVLRTYGFVYERDDNIIRVTTLENMQREELATEVFPLAYADAVSVTATVEDLLTERGRVRHDERTNVLIVTDIPTNVYRIRQVVEQIDAKTPQILLDSKIIETTLNDQENLGIDWSITATGRGSAIPTTFPFRNELSRTRFFGSGSTASESGETIGAGGTTTVTDAADFASAASFPFAEADDFVFGTLGFSQFQAVLEILNSRSDTHIKSNPHIVTLNNHPAEIVVGEILFIPTFERNAETGQFEITGYEERDLGLKLAVTPHVNARGDVVIDLEPEVTALTGFQQFTTEISAPLISTREATTRVMVKDNETIAIGGLIRENEVDVVKKVPIVGDIPLLGYLFKKKEKGFNKTDLLFFLTVHVLKEGAEDTLVVTSADPSDSIE